MHKLIAFIAVVALVAVTICFSVGCYTFIEYRKIQPQPACHCDHTTDRAKVSDVVKRLELVEKWRDGFRKPTGQVGDAPK